MVQAGGQTRRRLLRPGGRRTNVGLLIALALAFASGGLAFAVGQPSRAYLVTVAHAIAGLAVVALLPWKSLIVRRSLRRPRRTGRPRVLRILIGSTLGLLVAVSLVAGLVHAFAGYVVYGGVVTAMQVHVGAALLALPLLLGHVLAHPQRPRGSDLSRRVILRAGLVAAVGAIGWAAGEGAMRVLGLPGASRRQTGSHEVGSFDPAQMPVTQWLFDKVPRIDRDTWSVEVVSAAGSRRWTLDDLAGGDLSNDVDQVVATLDCTGGWYSTQVWRGVRLVDLLAQQPPGESVDVVSQTGYGRRFAYADLSSLWLVTHAGAERLSPGHGGPARLVAPDRRGFWWVKWVVRIEIIDGPSWLQAPFPLQ